MLWQDMKYAWRALARSPIFTAVAVLSLAVGIGVNIALFSTLNAVLLRDLPVRAPHELRVLHWIGPVPQRYSIAGEEMRYIGRRLLRCGEFSYPMYCTLRDEGEGFSEIFAFAPTDPFTVVARRMASRAEGLLVTGNFFAGYKAPILAGRPILPDDDHPAAQPVTVITYRAWQQYFGQDPNVIGETVMLNGDSYTVVGVLPRDHAGPFIGDKADFYIPLCFQSRLRLEFSLAPSHHYWLVTMVRLRPGTPEIEARESLERLWRRHAIELLPEDTVLEPGFFDLQLVDGRHGPVLHRQGRGTMALLLMKIGGLLLLIACANLAGLLLARNAAREHETAVRAALGAGWWRLVHQSLAESLSLSFAGAMLGLFLAWLGRAVLQSLLPALLYTDEGFRINLWTDVRVLAFTLGLTVATALLVGLLPGFLDARLDLGGRLGSTRVRGAPRARLGKALVVMQIALSLTLVVGTGLLLRSLVNLYGVELGFNPDNLVVCHLNAAQAGYEDPRRSRLYENVDQSLAALPGVRSTAFADQCHIGAGWGTHFVSVPDRSIQRLQTTYMTVSDAFFETLGIPLLLGRTFNNLDGPGPVRAAVVNEAFCQSAFAGENPVGRSFKVGDQDCQIVGVCGNATYYTLETGTHIWPITYFSCRQVPMPEVWFMMRAAGPPQALMPAVHRTVAALDPLIPLTVTTQADLCDATIATERMYAALGIGLTILAVALSCMGVYGLMAHNVALRMGEIGIRMALGARPQDVSRTILREAVLLAGAGAGIGIPLALIAVRIIRSFLYEIKPYDPLTLIAAVVVLLVAAVLAAWIPARRAARLDPIEALQCE